MNFIAGYLILITKSEEESFWLLDALVGRILPGMSKISTVCLSLSCFCLVIKIIQLISQDFIQT